MKKFLFTLSILFSVTSLFAARYYVSTSGNDANSGTSWDKAFADVQTAIDAAAEGASSSAPNEVWIAKGTYNHGSPMKMKPHVQIYGGFDGTETNKDQRIPGNETILDGNRNHQVFVNNYTDVSDDKSKILTETAVLDAVTIANGYSLSLGGGAIYNKWASPTISNCTFRDNTATSNGGAICSEDSNLKVINCTFINNNTEIFGGAIYNGEGTSKNEEEDRDTPPTFTNCTFYKNSSKISGGAVANESGSSKPIFINCTFVENSCSSAIENGGGAIYNNRGSAPEIVNCILWGNTAEGKTNEIYNFNGATAFVWSCVIEDEKDDKKGIFASDPELGELADNGGFVKTIAVSKYSTAAEKGTDHKDYIAYTPSVDARGKKRSGKSVTLGAYQYYSTKPTFISTHETSVNTYVGGSIELSVIVDSSDDAQLDYQWVKSNNKKEWFPVEENVSEAPSTLKLINITLAQDKYQYKCIVVDKDEKFKDVNKDEKFEGVKIETKPAKLSVVEKPVIKLTEGDVKLEAYDATNNEDGVKDSDCKIKISLKATGAKKLKYQWQYKYLNSDDWIDIPESENKTAVTARFQSNRMTEDDFNKKYRLSVTTTQFQSFDEVVVYPEKGYEPIKLSKATISNPNLPEDQECSDKDVATFEVEPSPSEDKYLKYQWQVSVDGGNTWKKAGSKRVLEVKKPKIKQTGSLYRCLVSNKGNPSNPAVSRVATLTVKAQAQFTKQPEITTKLTKKNVVYKGDEFSAKVEAVGYNTRYQWQYSLDGKKWNDVIGAISNELNVDTSSIEMPAGKDSTSIQYRCLAWSEDKNITGNVISKSLKVTVNTKVAFTEYSFKRDKVELKNIDFSDSYIEGIDTEDGMVVYAFAEYPLEMTVSATGYKPKYQWQYYSYESSTWNNIKGATKKNYKIKPLDSSDSGYYRCVVSNDGSSNSSDAFELFVIDCPVKSTLSGCYVEGFTDFISERSFDAIFVDKKNFRIEFDDGLVLEKPTYSIKRTSPTESTFTMSFKYEGTSYSFKGALNYDPEENSLIFLEDSKTKNEDSETKMNLTIPVDSIFSADSELEFIPENANDLVGTELNLAGDDGYFLNIVFYKRSKGCHVISPELPDEGEYKTLDSSYSYKNNKNGIVTITITTKDKFTNTTYKGELVLFEFSKDIKGIYTLESTDTNKQRSVKVVELLGVISD